MGSLGAPPGTNGRPALRAIELGLAQTGKLVTSGALILMFAFLVLSTSPGYEVKPLAIGIAAGIISTPPSSAPANGGPTRQSRPRVAGALGRSAQCSIVAHMWYKDGIARVRISTTVDEQLLATARQTRSELADSALIDEALGALLARNRAVEIDSAYAAYDRIPLDVDDEWGDLDSFRRAAGGS